MNLHADELKAFYATQTGGLVRRFIAGHIHKIWPMERGLRIVGAGYALPYLEPFQAQAGGCFALMSPRTGAHAWPAEGKNRVCLAENDSWPLETESVDRILLLHGLESVRRPDALLQECWRVLKSEGRLLIVVPNRLGFWARADWTPFGCGTPYTAGQIARHLQENQFVHTQTERALFMPPFRSFSALRSAYALEGIGRYVFPGLAGIYLVEARKKVYAGAVRSRVSKTQRVLVAKTTPAG